MHHVYAWEARRGHWITWDYSYRLLWPPMWMLGLKPGPPEVQPLNYRSSLYIIIVKTPSATWSWEPTPCPEYRMFFYQINNSPLLPLSPFSLHRPALNCEKCVFSYLYLISSLTLLIPKFLSVVMKNSALPEWRSLRGGSPQAADSTLHRQQATHKEQSGNPALHLLHI